MAWDIKIDRGSGDYVFGPGRDLMGVSGSDLVNQRILTRCKIPRGTFQNDEDQTLGSELHLLTGKPIGSISVQVEAAVRDALEHMDDIVVIDVISRETEDHLLLVNVRWSPASAEGEPADEITEPAPVFDTNVTF